MKKFVLVAWTLLAFVSTNAGAEAEIADAGLRKAVHDLSAATLADGAGWQAYERLLHPNYTRWAMGEVYEGREKFVRSLEAWWDYGMRVAERNTEMVAVDMYDDLAVVRFRINEKFAGPDGPVAEGFSGYVSNTWIREGENWLLLSAEISSTQRQD